MPALIMPHSSHAGAAGIVLSVSLLAQKLKTTNQKLRYLGRNMLLAKRTTGKPNASTVDSLTVEA